jgi:hypothetical protein
MDVELKYDGFHVQTRFPSLASLFSYYIHVIPLREMRMHMKTEDIFAILYLFDVAQ